MELDAGLPSQYEMREKVDVILQAVGVMHDDLVAPAGNVLYTYNQGPPPTVRVKVIDFGQATPSGAVILDVGQP